MEVTEGFELLVSIHGVTAAQAANLRHLTGAAVLFDSMHRRTESAESHSARKVRLGLHEELEQATACDVMDALEVKRLLDLYILTPDPLFKDQADTMRAAMEKLLAFARATEALSPEPALNPPVTLPEVKQKKKRKRKRTRK